MAQANSDLRRFDHRDLALMSVWLSEVISLVLKDAYTPQESALKLFGVPRVPPRRLRLVSYP